MPGEETIGQRLLAFNKLLNRGSNRPRTGVFAVVDDDDAGMARLHWNGPRTPPFEPSFLKKPEVSTIVGDEDTLQFGRYQELSRVCGAPVTKPNRRSYVVTHTA